MDDSGKQVSWLVAQVRRVTFPGLHLLQIQWSRRAAHHLQLRGQPGLYTRVPFESHRGNLSRGARMSRPRFSVKGLGSGLQVVL